MDVLACIKRVPDTGAKIVLTEDNQGIDTSNLGFTMSPHEECAIEEAIALTEEHGGTSTVLTVGPADADEQLRTGLAMQADDAILLETDGSEWSASATANAIADEIAEHDFDLAVFGNESADAANYQVGVRVARALGWPVVAGVKGLEVEDGKAIAHREVPGGEEIYEIELPAIITVKEGINEPRYASMRSKMHAQRADIPTKEPAFADGGGTLEMLELEAPPEDDSVAEILGEGPEAVDAIIDILENEVEVL